MILKKSLIKINIIILTNIFTSHKINFHQIMYISTTQTRQQAPSSRYTQKYNIVYCCNVECN